MEEFELILERLVQIRLDKIAKLENNNYLYTNNIKIFMKSISNNRNSNKNVELNFYKDSSTSFNAVENKIAQFEVGHEIFNIAYEKNDFFQILDYQYSDFEEIQTISEDKNYLWIPLYFEMSEKHPLFFCKEEEFLNYENPTDFGGQIGLVFIDKNNIRQHYNIKNVTTKIKDKVINDMMSFVKTNFC